MSRFDIPPALALKDASEKHTKGIVLTRIKVDMKTQRFRQVEYRVCEFKLYWPQFNSDVSPVLKYEQLSIHTSGKLSAIVQMVTFQSWLYAHKFMTKDRLQHEFEVEVQRYQLLKGSQGVLEFKGIVQAGGIL